MQLRLLPEAQPLVDRLGRAFFRTLPTHPGVYLLRDSRDDVLYVGKAKNLRKRLNSYRVANRERLPRRLLRLLHQAARIEWHACPDEAAALARERELLLSLRPRFNRAGVWPAPPRFLAWRATETALELTIRAPAQLRRLFAGDVEVFGGWLGAGLDLHPFEREALAVDLETVTEFVRAAVRRQTVAG